MQTEINVVAPEGELILRQGQALPLKEPAIVDVAGDINTIAAFMTCRRDTFPGFSTQAVLPDRAIVFVNETERTITVALDPENPYGATVSGRLLESDELKAFCINKPKTFKREELVKLLRFSRRYFSDGERYSEVLAAYQAFRATANTEIGASSDTRGNKAVSFSREVKSNLPTMFSLTMPVFKGEDKMTFMVEVCQEVTDGNVAFWFESPELEELMYNKADEIIQRNLATCEGLVIVKQ